MDKQTYLKNLYTFVSDNYPEYKGWTFDVDFHTEAFYYGTVDEDENCVDCFFTPDYHDDGMLALAIMNDWGDCVYEPKNDIPWTLAMSFVEIIALVHKAIDQHGNPYLAMRKEL